MSEPWFSKGVDDPDLALVRVSISHAERWDIKENKALQLFKMARAAVTGKRPTGMGEHGEVRMQG